jgi:hypothetical protein
MLYIIVNHILWINICLVNDIVPHDKFTTCNHPYLVQPPLDLGMGHYTSYSKSKGGPMASMTPKKEHMEAFMVCALTNALNNAMKFFKKHHNSSSTSAGNLQHVLLMRGIEIRHTVCGKEDW